MIEQIIGYSAAAFIAANMIPQIVKSMKTKEVDDLSWNMLFLVFTGTLLWLVYGLITLNFPIIVSDGFGLITILMLVFIKIKFEGGKN